MVCKKQKMKFTFKIWLLIIILVMSLLSIFGLPPTFLQKGVVVTNVETNSTISELGLKQGDIIKSIDGNSINSLDDFSREMKGKFDGKSRGSVRQGEEK